MAAKEAKRAWPTVADVRRITDAAFEAPVSLQEVTKAIRKSLLAMDVEEVGRVFILVDHMEQAADLLRDETDELREAIRAVEVPELDWRRSS